ncbi:MAG: DUF6702 family protein [Gemmatimonadaceae bacterium]
MTRRGLVARAATIGLVVIAALGAAERAGAHPLHTTLTQLTWLAPQRAVQVSIRVFADDFATVVAKRGGVKPAADHAVPDSAAFAYLRASFALAERSGPALPLSWCGSKRTGDVVWLCVRARMPAGLARARIHNRFLFDLYADQINIVQAEYEGHRRSLLFTTGDPPKQLP